MANLKELDQVSQSFQKTHQQRQVILTFPQFLDLVKAAPARFIRNSSKYLLDTFEHFGTRETKYADLVKSKRFSLFDLGTDRGGPIIGGESVQNDLYFLLKKFDQNGYNSKLILLHGPNGSAKSSTVETIANGMQDYSQTPEGAVYRFNWIFPADRSATPLGHREGGAIGFASPPHSFSNLESFALLDEYKIASKISSEFKDNPLFLIPMPYREDLLKTWLAEKNNIPVEDVKLPPHILTSGLSKKNQQIFECLLNAYDGEIQQVFRHVQIERFFYSRQYRVGISTIEPQMSIDAHEKQITLDRNYANLPALLQTISFHEDVGELVEANRGLLEFSDLLKRPVEAFKYLLSTIEKGVVNFPSGTANLDVVFLATTNDKHLDAFKTIPDFSSFKGRFELLQVPYLLLPSLEEQIYKSDLETISKFKHVSPHSMHYLASWAVMTRLKQPDPELYPKELRPLITRLDPRKKVLLYEKAPLQSGFSHAEENSLLEIREQLWHESQGLVVYEGRFGASPREIRAILYRAAYNQDHEELTPITIFEELRSLVKNRTVYEFLQFEPRDKYHDIPYFIDILQEDFLNTFEREVIDCMEIASQEEYVNLLKRYITHVASQIKKEKIWDDSTNTHMEPSETLMSDVEKLLGVSANRSTHRMSMMSRIAAYRLENPSKEINVEVVFVDYLSMIKEHFYKNKRTFIDHIFKVMISLPKPDSQVSKEDHDKAKETMNNLQTRYGYKEKTIIYCLQFLMKQSSRKN